MLQVLPFACHRATLPDSDTGPWIWRQGTLSNRETKLAEKGYSQGSVIGIKKPQNPRVTIFLLESCLHQRVCASQGPAHLPLILSAFVSELNSKSNGLRYAWWPVLLCMLQTMPAPGPLSSQTFPHSETSPSLLGITTCLFLWSLFSGMFLNNSTT